MSLPLEILEAVRQGRCVLFLGSRAATEVAEAAGRNSLAAGALARKLGWLPPRKLMGSHAKHVTPSVASGASGFQAQHGREALIRELRPLVAMEGVSPGQAHHLALRHFPFIFTTCWDTMLERAAEEEGRPLVVIRRGEPWSEPAGEGRVLVRWRGGFDEPFTPILTQEDHKTIFQPAFHKQMRKLVLASTLFFVGFRPDEEEFEYLWEELTDAYGGELPRCHMAVAQGRMDDFLWQKWVWRGLLLFTADPRECLVELDTTLGS